MLVRRVMGISVKEKKKGTASVIQFPFMIANYLAGASLIVVNIYRRGTAMLHNRTL
jgi:hypothetical protein